MVSVFVSRYLSLGRVVLRFGILWFCWWYFFFGSTREIIFGIVVIWDVVCGYVLVLLSKVRKFGDRLILRFFRAGYSFYG